MFLLFYIIAVKSRRKSFANGNKFINIFKVRIAGILMAQ
jgi:hypothetical protein